MSQYNIFVDTNVLINAYRNKEEDRNCLQYLYALKGKRLYISALSVAQFVSVFQKVIDNSTIRKYVEQLLHRFIVVSFNEQDIRNAIKIDGSDIEDNIQYSISQKVKCPYFITNNLKDYRHYDNLASVMKPSEVRLIHR